MKPLLQIIPRAPADCGGVGDYAQLLGLRLRELRGIESTFISAAPVGAAQTVDGFSILSPLRSLDKIIDPGPDLLLHFVNYGYDPRGVPIWLPSLLRRLRKVAGGNLVTVFHELYASGSWRQSAFWLHPVQKQIARAIARLSASCIVSNENQRAQLLGLAPEANVRVQPVPSNFGEPSFSTTDLAQRDPHRWVICGGTALVARSLNSFLQNRIVIPPSVTPHELVVVGGAESAEVRTALRKVQGIQTSYHPAIAASAASRILSTCAFGWLDYLHTPDVPMTTILKSTVFAAFCAHGIMSVFPHSGTSIHLGQDSLPGPYYISADAQSLPPLSERVSTAHLIHEWYRRNASSQQLAETIVNALGWPALTHDES